MYAISFNRYGDATNKIFKQNDIESIPKVTFANGERWRLNDQKPRCIGRAESRLHRAVQYLTTRTVFTIENSGSLARVASPGINDYGRERKLGINDRLTSYLPVHNLRCNAPLGPDRVITAKAEHRVPPTMFPPFSLTNPIFPP